jgi:hypothetical protein
MSTQENRPVPVEPPVVPAPVPVSPAVGCAESGPVVGGAADAVAATGLSWTFWPVSATPALPSMVFGTLS